MDGIPTTVAVAGLVGTCGDPADAAEDMTVTGLALDPPCMCFHI